MDLGECPKIHDLALRADYQQAAKSKDCFYDVEVSKLRIDCFYSFMCCLKARVAKSSFKSTVLWLFVK